MALRAFSASVDRYRHTRASGVLAIGLVLASGCALPDGEPQEADEDVSVTEAAVYANRDILWPSPTGRTDVPVCWVNPGSAPGATAAERATWRDARRRAVEEAWARNARINFYGWDGSDPVTNPTQCTSSTSLGVHITICTLPTDSRCPALPASQGVILSTSSSGSVASVRTNPSHGPSIMVHEFGHTLGLYHEEERPDAPNISTGPCAKQSWPNADPVLYGAYDDHSTMSYCHPPTAAPWLSANDIAGIQRAYARRLPGSLVTPRGNCAAAHHADGAGDRAFTWDCDEANRDQQWNDTTATSSGDAFSLYITGVTDTTRYCLAATGAAAGAAVQLATCLTSNDWRLESMFLRGFGGRCLDLRNGDTTVGTPIQMWTCGALGGANQRWSRTRAGQIRYGTTDRCARIGASGRLEIGLCNTADSAQLFVFSSSRILPASNTSQCLDVIGPSDAQFTSGLGLLGDGAQVQLMPCDAPTLNQRWHVSGGLRYDGNTALCLARGVDANGSALSLASCTGSDETQTWDYYF